jgi:hypothetical protein
VCVVLCDVMCGWALIKMWGLLLGGGGGGGSRKRYFIENKVLLVSRKYNVGLGSGFARGNVRR